MFILLIDFNAKHTQHSRHTYIEWDCFYQFRCWFPKKSIYRILFLYQTIKMINDGTMDRIRQKWITKRIGCEKNEVRFFCLNTITNNYWGLFFQDLTIGFEKFCGIFALPIVLGTLAFSIFIFEGLLSLKHKRSQRSTRKFEDQEDYEKQFLKQFLRQNQALPDFSLSDYRERTSALDNFSSKIEEKYNVLTT